MSNRYVLVDFENVQPDLSALAQSQYKVKVFFGAKQQEGRVPFKLLDALLSLGGNVEPVKILRTGRNAVDMHIAYYVGGLLAAEPDAVIHIVSGDTDFDPLVEFLRAKGVDCRRTKSVAELAKGARGTAHPPKAPPVAAKKKRAAPAPRAAPPKKHAQRPAKTPEKSEPRVEAHAAAPHDDLAPVLTHLQSMKNPPKTRKALSQTIANYFRQHGGPRNEDFIEGVIEELFRRRVVTLSGAKVVYSLTS